MDTILFLQSPKTYKVQFARKLLRREASNFYQKEIAETIGIFFFSPPYILREIFSARNIPNLAVLSVPKNPNRRYGVIEKNPNSPRST